MTWAEIVRRFNRPRLLAPLIAIAVVCAIWLPNQGILALRSVRALLDLAHIPLLALVIFYVWLRRPDLSSRPAGYRFTLILSIALLFGGAIELIQALVDRTGNPSLEDLRRDLIGGLGAAVFLVPTGVSARRQRRWLCAVTLAVVLLESRGLAVAIYEDLQLARQFPLLADFETPWQETRWSSGDLITDPAASSEHRLRVAVGEQPYAGVELLHFVRDWSDHRELAFAVFNPARRSRDLYVKLQDRAGMMRGNSYSDRYNGVFGLVPGWNRLRVPLTEVAAGPAHRQLDLTEVAQFELFFARPNFGYFLLDDIRLRQTAAVN